MTKTLERDVQLHVSGKTIVGDDRAADRRRDQFANYVDHALERTKATRFTATEGRGTGVQLRQALGDQWAVDLEGEFPIAVHRDHAELGDGWLSSASDAFHGSADWRDAHVHWRYLRTEAGTELLGVTHLSSAVQAGRAWSGFADGVRSHREATAHIGEVVAKHKARGIDVTLAGDMNLDLHLWLWRQYMRRSTGLEGCWDDKALRPRGGTHHRRLIDEIRSTREIPHARLVSGDRPWFLDHQPFLAVLGEGRYDGRPGRKPQDHGTLTPLGSDS